MKILVKVALLFAVIVVGIGAYTHFVVAPEEMQLNSNSIKEYGNTGLQRLWQEKNDLKFNLGNISLFGGAIATIIALYLVVKMKNLLAVTVLILALLAFYFGAANATHMFS